MEKFNEFGHGILCPFQRDGKGDFINGSGLGLLKSDVKELIGIIGPTRTQPGELPWRTRLGSRIMAMKHRRMHPEMVRSTADQFVTPTIRKFEPRVIPGPSSVQSEPLSTKLVIVFSYMPNVAVGKSQYESIDFTIEE